jgi:hypothetical protein
MKSLVRMFPRRARGFCQSLRQRRGDVSHHPCS